jgi:hypothetical protein
MPLSTIGRCLIHRVAISLAYLAFPHPMTG